ncbi:MAG: hypothetical protein BRC26_02660, partial [Nanohaloarchaea archaeon QH_8_44_6]
NHNALVWELNSGKPKKIRLQPYSVNMAFDLLEKAQNYAKGEKTYGESDLGELREDVQETGDKYGLKDSLKALVYDELSKDILEGRKVTETDVDSVVDYLDSESRPRPKFEGQELSKGKRRGRTFEGANGTTGPEYLSHDEDD